MNFARALSAFSILIVFSVYIFLNTRIIEGAVGNELFVLYVAAFGFLLVISGNLANIVLWRVATVFIAVFFVYVAAKYYFETGDSFLTRSRTLGTDHGLVFGFLFGLIISQSLSAIYDLRKDTRSNAVLYLMTFLYIVMLCCFAILTFLTHKNSGVGEVFLVEEQVSYQRVGDLLALQFIVITALVCVVMVTSPRRTFTGTLMLVLPLITLCGVYALISQLVGSNKGFVVPIGVLLVFLAVLISSSNQRKTRRTSILNILLSGLVFKLLFAGLFGLVLIAVFGGSLLGMLGISLDDLRIFGFGSGEVSSVTSRSDLFSANFYTHFMYSPFFGNTQVELLTTGPGTYVHSTLSILTHLGLFGFLLFLCILICVYMEISHSFQSKYSSIHGNQPYGLFRLLCLFTILVMGSFSAFFTWMPLWFSLGLFGNWYHQSREQHQLVGENKVSRRRRRRKSLLLHNR